jgi:hypothetical protein
MYGLLARETRSVLNHVLFEGASCCKFYAYKLGASEHLTLYVHNVVVKLVILDLTSHKKHFFVLLLQDLL